MPNDWESPEEDENLWNITNGDEVFQGKPLDPRDEDPHLFQYVPPQRSNDLNEALEDLRDGGYRWNIEQGEQPDMWRIQHKQQPISHDISSRDLNLKGYQVYYNDPYLPRATGHGAEYNSGHFFLHDTADPSKSPTRIWATQRADEEGWQRPEPGALNEPYMRERFPDLWQKHWGAADPPDWKDKYNYREAQGPKSCSTCSAFKGGKCEMFDASAEADMTCDEWSDTWKKTGMAVSPDILEQHINENGPFLWHGTHIKNLPSILQHGILPRGDVPAGADAFPWSQHSQPMTGATYLRNMSNHQAQGYFEKEDEPQSVLFAVDSRKLDPKKIINDEDNIPDRWNDESRRLMDEEGIGAGDAFRQTVPGQIEDVDQWHHQSLDIPNFKGSRLPYTLAYDGPIPADAIAGLYHQNQWYDPEDYEHDFLGMHRPDDLGFETYAKFILKADWNDVMSKAKRLIQEGKVTIVNNTPQHVMARVIGDGSDNEGNPDMHEVEFSRDDPNSNVITQSVCDCAYNQYRWDRTRPWKKLEGRPCSHILAAYWKSKSTPQDIEGEAPGYQVPVGQKGPASPQGQLPIPGAMPGTTKKDLGFGEGAFGPEGQEGPQPSTPEQPQAPEIPSTQQLGIPGQPDNPFNPPKPSGPRPTGPPQREQMTLFNLSPEPSTQPPNPSVSVPGATPPTPENPVQLPGTFSRWHTAAVDDEMLQHFIAQQGNGDPIYVATTKPQTLEYRGGKTPMPGAQPYDVSSEGVPLYKMLELGYNPETGRRETADVNELSGAPEWRGQYGEVPMNRRGEVRDFDPHLGWAQVHVPLHYPGGEDARLHPHSLSGWVPMNELRVVHPPRTPFRRR